MLNLFEMSLLIANINFKEFYLKNIHVLFITKGIPALTIPSPHIILIKHYISQNILNFKLNKYQFSLTVQ